MSKSPIEHGRGDRPAGEEFLVRGSSGLDEAIHPMVAAILDGVPDMVFIKEASSLRFRLINRAGEILTGLDRDAVLTRTDYDVWPREAGFYQEKDREVLETGNVLEIAQEPIRTRTGTRLLQTRKFPILGPDGRPLYVVGVSRDITENRAVHLEQAIVARDEVLALVAHDLKNPLATILMATDGLGCVASHPTVTAARIHRAAERMNRLIEDLVDGASIEAGKFLIDPREERVDPLLDEALEAMAPLASSRGQSVERHILGSYLDLHCDRDLILRVLSNLIGNAVKFTPSGGRIQVSASGRRNSVRFEVADTGPGIPQDALEHVFDRFWQARRSGRASAGLGLYIVKGIVEAHGGTVWAENKPGGGSAFSFLLPRHRAPVPPA